MAEKRLFRELKLLIKTHPLATNKQIVELAPVDEESSILAWKAVIAKPTKDDNPYYYNGQWKLDIVADKSYPIKPPVINFSRLTPINHPNVNIDTGEICLDILKSEAWSPAWNLEHLVLAILMLIDNPEPDSPLNVDLANLFRYDKEAFELVVQYFMWKLNTLYEGRSELSGVKAWSILAYDNSSEEEDESDVGTDEKERNDEITSVLMDPVDENKDHAVKHESKQTTKDTESVSESSSSVSPSTKQNGASESENAKSSEELMGPNCEMFDSNKTCEYHPVSTTSNVDIVQSVGEEVKRELIDKAAEVEAHSLVPSKTSSALLHTVHDRVREKVTNQVEEILNKSASNPQSASNRHESASNPQPASNRHESASNRQSPKGNTRTDKKQDVEKAKERFLGHIHEQVSGLKKLHELQRTVVQ